LRNSFKSLLFLIYDCKGLVFRNHIIFFIFGVVIFGCTSKNKIFVSERLYNKNEVWKQSNSRIIKYIKVYKKNQHVKTCLDRAKSKRYLYYIHRVFYKYELPPELAYLPILESCFDYKADSGSALGMWQFTKATAKDYGLDVTFLSDDRLNWRKSTDSAARYLKILGERFDNNWELALAGYNGGPNYMEKQIRSQGTRNFWKLKLRKETHEYVPKFLAMLRVARNRYPELYFQGAPRAWVKSG
tara:strand:- start:120 stop:848 length:729 start_codon:yes stop_codon:yes gene_type:complete